jgi:hypothetical protein
MSCQYTEDMKWNEVIQFRVASGEKAFIEGQAIKEGISVSELLRRKFFFDPPKDSDGPRPYDDPEMALEVHRDLGNTVLIKLTKQLEAQGKKPDEADRVARKRLGL